MPTDAEYFAMVSKLRPLAWKYFDSETQELEQSALDAGEPYGPMTDLLWYAAQHGADQNLIREAYNLLDEEDKPDFKQFLKHKEVQAA